MLEYWNAGGALRRWVVGAGCWGKIDIIDSVDSVEIPESAVLP